jgi:hypothetical protein
LRVFCIGCSFFELVKEAANNEGLDLKTLNKNLHSGSYHSTAVSAVPKTAGQVWD